MRHGQSVGNEADQFTGWQDVGLTDRGRAEAANAAALVMAGGFTVNGAFSSTLKRAQETCRIVLAGIGRPELHIILSEDLRERDYGRLTGLTKYEARQVWGEAHVEGWRRSYDLAPPDGESLKDTGARVWPYYIRFILPAVMCNGTILLVAHGNSLRALSMVLDGLSHEDVVNLEIPTARPGVYRCRSDAIR